MLSTQGAIDHHAALVEAKARANYARTQAQSKTAAQEILDRATRASAQTAREQYKHTGFECGAL